MQDIFNIRRKNTNIIIISIAIVLIVLNVIMLVYAPENFELLPYLSFIASFLLIFVLLPEYFKHRSSTILLLSVCVILKYIVTPFFYCLYPINSFSYYSPHNLKNINYGIILMIYEVIAVSFSTCFFAKKDFINNKKVTIETNQRDEIIYSKNGVVIVFVFFATAIFLLFPISRNGLSFLMLKANTGVRVSSLESSSLSVLLREFVLIGFYSAFAIISVVCAKKYLKSKSKLYILVALLSAILVTSIIVSEARSSQIYCGYACITLLGVLFPESKERIKRILIGVIISIVLVLSIYKTFYAFKYQSYFDALSSTSLSANMITYNLEAYCLGPLHYTAIVDLGFWNDTFSLSRFVFGILRTIMGTNLLVKSIDMNTTSMVFNEFVTGNRMNTGYLLPITGVGYFYFSPILAPVITCLVYRIASKLEYKMKKARSFFSLFFMSYVYIRVATCIVFTNINTILSMSSMILLTAGIIGFVNKYIKIR